MSARIRKRLSVDDQVQGAISRRLGLYFCTALVFMLLPSTIARTFLEPERLFLTHLWDVIWEYWPLLLTLTAAMPFVFYDTLKLSNRFAGPIYRLRRQLQRFGSGEVISPIKFRDDDFWQDLATEVNTLLERVRAAEEPLRPTNSCQMPQTRLTGWMVKEFEWRRTLSQPERRRGRRVGSFNRDPAGSAESRIQPRSSAALPVGSRLYEFAPTPRKHPRQSLS